MPQQQPKNERPPVDPAIIGLVIIAVAIFLIFALRYFHVIPWSGR